MTDENELRGFLREVIAEKGELDDDFSDDEVFNSDLDLDSLVMLEVIVDVEKKYGVKIPEERYGDFSSVNAAVSLVQEMKQS